MTALPPRPPGIPAWLRIVVMADELPMLPVAAEQFRAFIGTLSATSSPEDIGLTLRARFPWTEGLVAWMTSSPEQIAAAELPEGVVEATRSLADLVQGPLAAGMREVYAAYYESYGLEVESRGALMRSIAARGAAEAALREEIARCQASGDDRRLATLLRETARLVVYQGQLAEARGLHDQRLALVRKLGDAEGVANAQWDLANLDLQDADLTSAQPRLEEAYTSLEGTGEVHGLALVATRLGEVLIGLGQADRARTVLGVAVDRWTKLRDTRGLGQANALLATLDHV